MLELTELFVTNTYSNVNIKKQIQFCPGFFKIDNKLAGCRKTRLNLVLFFYIFLCYSTFLMIGECVLLLC